jgi:hypothetical protein
MQPLLCYTAAVKVGGPANALAAIYLQKLARHFRLSSRFDTV